MFGGKKTDDRPEAAEAPVHVPASKSDAEARTQIGPGTVIKGELSVQGDAIIYGTVEGNLTATQQVEVMKSGTVKADIRGKGVRVIGRVEGRIMSQDRVQLMTGAHVRGDIHSQSLKIEEGVFFQGACVMGDSAQASLNPKIVPLPQAAPEIKARAAGG